MPCIQPLKISNQDLLLTKILEAELKSVLKNILSLNIIM
jgi:hypothetical protein